MIVYNRYGTAAANTAVAVTFPAMNHVAPLTEEFIICASYTAAPTGGALTIAQGSTTVFSTDIIAGGPTSIPFRITHDGSEVVTITLAAGSGSVVGKLAVARVVRKGDVVA